MIRISVADSAAVQDEGMAGDPARRPGGAMDEAARAHCRVEILNFYGLHLRAAARFVRLARSFRAEVSVESRGVRGNGQSVLDLVGLSAGCGTTLDLEACGPDAEEALSALADLVAARFRMTDEDGCP